MNRGYEGPARTTRPTRAQIPNQPTAPDPTLREIVRSIIQYSADFGHEMSWADDAADRILALVPVATRGPLTDAEADALIERVEDTVSMGKGAWDMVEGRELARAFVDAIAAPSAPEMSTEDWIRSLPRGKPGPQKWDDDEAPETREPERDPLTESLLEWWDAGEPERETLLDALDKAMDEQWDRCFREREPRPSPLADELGECCICGDEVDGVPVEFPGGKCPACRAAALLRDAPEGPGYTVRSADLHDATPEQLQEVAARLAPAEPVASLVERLRKPINLGACTCRQKIAPCPECDGLTEYDADRVAAANALTRAAERERALVGLLVTCREAVASLPADALGEGSTACTAPDGEAAEMKWPIRDELIDHISRALAAASPVESEP